MIFMQVNGLVVVVLVGLICLLPQSQNTSYNFQNTHIQISVLADTDAHYEFECFNCGSKAKFEIYKKLDYEKLRN
jgi:hypothetical protein